MSEIVERITRVEESVKGLKKSVDRLTEETIETRKSLTQLPVDVKELQVKVEDIEDHRKDEGHFRRNIWIAVITAFLTGAGGVATAISRLIQ